MEDEEMRVLQIYPYYPPAYEYGGALRVVQSIAKALVKKGHDVTVYTTDTAGSDGRIQKQSPVDVDGVTVHYFPNLSNVIARRAHVAVPIGMRRTLAQEITSFDLVHIHGFPHILAWLAARAALVNDIPFVLTPHGTINRPGDTKVRLKRAFRAIFGRAILQADRVLPLTTDEADRLNDIGISNTRLHRVPNGIDPAQIETPVSATEFRTRYGLEEKWLVVFVGRIHPTKGPDIFVESSAALDDHIDGRELSFVIIGPDDGYESDIEEFVEERNLNNVTLLGYLPEDEKNAALSAADIYALPSRGEGQPISVLEACAAGTPVVVSDECSLPEIEQAGAGLVVSANPDSFSTAIENILRNAEKQAIMGKRGRQLVEERFTWDSVTEELQRIYKEVSDGRGSER